MLHWVKCTTAPDPQALHSRSVENREQTQGGMDDPMKDLRQYSASCLLVEAKIALCCSLDKLAGPVGSFDILGVRHRTVFFDL